MLKRTINKSYRKTRDNVVKQVRENYLRTDIPCLSELCPTRPTCQERVPAHHHTGLLAGDASAYIIPDTKTLARYAEIFIQSELTNVIYNQTSFNSLINHERNKTARALRQAIESPARQSVFFYNGYFQGTHVARQPHETLYDRDWRAILACAQWYRRHLRTSIPIILLAEKDEQARYQDLIASDDTGVTVTDLESYLKEKFGNSSDLLDHFESVKFASYGEFCGSDLSGYLKTKKSTTLYPNYLSTSELETRLKRRDLYQGVLVVKKNRRDHATVRIILPDGSEQAVLIPSQTLQNRAVHGDVVAIKLLDDSTPEPSDSGSDIDSESVSEDENGEFICLY
ncbi:hypothetical protein BJ085DRAFT_37278 [Dimargaris cristalligena]|uniref:CSD1 domain-containing protein n=1 Tax=Dimargaris cristalligena TaxID=215637 RepID=A0A4P9ZXM2_9FUNG|nr:hypothetical protein BJ085DRAFT_37278 [Dimargaris cristalligena]|eukprot:RKP38424.1 hypothetical protein BJ085DRAFT_37278 [Dimargaris cristalligena]